MYSNSLGFYLGSRFIAYYGLLIVLGIGAGCFVGYLQCKKHHLNFENLILLFATCALFGIVCSKLLYLAVSFKNIDFSRITDLTYLNSLFSGGFIFYGGLIGAILGFVFAKKVFKIDVNTYIQKCISCLPTAHGFGRIGCSIVGCCYGKPYSGVFSVCYTNSLFAPNNMHLFPVQGVEALSEFLIAGLLLYYVNKKNGTKAFEIYLLFYAILRFFLEFFRYDSERGSFLFFSVSQWISILIIVGYFIYRILKKKLKKCGASLQKTIK